MQPEVHPAASSELEQNYSHNSAKICFLSFQKKKKYLSFREHWMTPLDLQLQSLGDVRNNNDLLLKCLASESQKQSE